jgi:hypothetical protein
MRKVLVQATDRGGEVGFLVVYRHDDVQDRNAALGSDQCGVPTTREIVAGPLAKHFDSGHASTLLRGAGIRVGRSYVRAVSDENV